MIEIKYLSKNDKGFSIDDIKASEFSEKSSIRKEYLAHLNGVSFINKSKVIIGKSIFVMNPNKKINYFYYEILDNLGNEVSSGGKITGTKIGNQKYFDGNEFSKFKDFLKESLSNLGLGIPKGKIDKVEVKPNIKNSKLQNFNFKLDED